jgi:hypothetical protein
MNSKKLGLDMDGVIADFLIETRALPVPEQIKKLRKQI